MQKNLIKLLNVLPYEIALLPYHTAYYLVKFLTFFYPIKTWARNSYVHKNIIPGISDIDFTCLCENSIKNKQIDSFIKLFSLIRRTMPILGEVNMYRINSLSLTRQLINPLELKRDPILANILEGTHPTKFEKFVYLLRMLDSDIKHLANIPEKRWRKWNFHFNDVLLKTPIDITLPNVINRICDLNPMPNHQDEILNFLQIYSREGLAEAYSFCRKKRLIHIFIVLYPHRWLVYANGINDVDICLNVNSFNAEAFELIISQLKWELAGLQSQFHTLKQKSEVFSYLDLILNFLKKIKTQDCELKKSEIIAHVLSLRDSLENASRQ
jgi:hypothetical protein